MPLPGQSGVIDERTDRGLAPGLMPGQTVAGSAPAQATNLLPTTPTGGTGTGTGTPLVDDGTGLAPLTGWAGQQGFTPANLPAIYENPWYLLPYVFQNLGTSTPLYQSLRDFGADPLALYNIAMGSKGVVDQSGGASGNDFANWLANLYQQLGTPGGQGISAGELIRSVFGPGGEGPETTLGQILGAGDMGTQVRTIFNLLRDASNAGMNPLAARGYQSALAQAGDRYGSEQLKAGEDTSMSFQQWANKHAPWLTAR